MRRRDFAKVAGAAVVAPRIILSDRVASLPATVRHTGAWPSYERAIAIDCLASPGPFNTPDATANPLTRGDGRQREVVRHHGGEPDGEREHVRGHVPSECPTGSTSSRLIPTS